MNIKEIQDKLEKFAEERDWDQFHSPKNLVMALTSEVGELNELFQWLSQEQSSMKDDPTKADEIGQEIADIFIYLLRLADKLEIDIEDKVREKIEINAKKYPVELAKGNATKYNKR